MRTIADELRDELRAAHIIIRGALTVMTFAQKMEWANANERDDAIGEGVTRANERQAVIDSGCVVELLRELTRADRIIANAEGLTTHHQKELWARANQIVGGLVEHGNRDGLRKALLARATASLTVVWLNPQDRTASINFAGECCVAGLRTHAELESPDVARQNESVTASGIFCFLRRD